MREIISKYKGSIKTIIKNFTGSYNEDIEQEVYVKAWKNLNKYKEQNKFRQWINSITANACRDFLKSRTQKEENNTLYNSEILDIAQKERYDALESKERQKIILKEINKLPTKLKETIIYFELEEKSYEEISVITKSPTGTVKSRLHSARELLRKSLQHLM